MLTCPNCSADLPFRIEGEHIHYCPFCAESLFPRIAYENEQMFPHGYLHYHNYKED